MLGVHIQKEVFWSQSFLEIMSNLPQFMDLVIVNSFPEIP